MRHSSIRPRARAYTLIFALTLASQADATPVFKQPESRFPSGEYARAWLEDHTESAQSQKWYRVQTETKTTGWVPEDHVLTPLKFVDEALVKEDQPARTAPLLDSLKLGSLIPKGSSVLILEIIGMWARVQPLPASENGETWLQAESLIPKLESASRVFIHTPSSLKVLPGIHSRSNGEVSEQSMVQLISEKKDWLEVHTKFGNGFVERRNAWTAKDLAGKNLRPALIETPIHSLPSPTAPVIETLGLGAKLTALSAKELRWGRVTISGLGQVWWPIDDAANEKSALAAAKTAATETLPSKDLFKRKIFDMAASQASPSLKFVSAEGVFRTLDNEMWSKIPLFKNENQPIAIAKAGPIFVGPYRSDDLGETFHQWIRWERLVSVVSKPGTKSAKSLRIAEIRPDDDLGNALTLRLSLDNGEAVRVKTTDGGKSWLQF
jgi:hypothetical protein